MKRRPRLQFSAEEMRWIKENSKLPRRQLQVEFARTFAREDVDYSNMKALCVRNGWGKKAAGLRYSPAEIAFIEARKSMPKSELRERFTAQFGREVSKKSLQSLFFYKGWSPKAVGTRYSPAEIAFIEERKSLPRTEMRKQFIAEFGREVSLVSLRSACSHRGWGGVGNSLLRAPVGHEYLNRDGRIEVKINGPSEPRKVVLKNRLLWEKKHGPIPPGMCLKCKTLDTSNADPSNWVLLPRGVLYGLVRRDFSSASPSLQEAIVAVAELEDAIRRRRRSKKKDDL